MNDVNEDQEVNLLSAENILAAEDLEPITVHVPEWKGYVRLRPLTAAEALLFSSQNQKAGQNGAVKIVAMSAVDAAGAPLFTEQQVKALAKKSLRPIMRLQTECLKLNGLRDEDDKEAAKNA